MGESASNGPREKAGTFLVTAVDDTAVVLRDVHDGEVITVAADEADRDPPVQKYTVLEASLQSEPPLHVTWTIDDVADQRSITVERSTEAPTKRARTVAADQPVGEVSRLERAGEGELHVLSVPADETDAAAADVRDDEETLARAARLGVERVEVRTGESVLSVRYLP